MKILFASAQLPHADVVSGHVIVYERVKRLCERGHEVGLVVFGDGEDRALADGLLPMLKELEIIPPPRVRTKSQRLLDRCVSPIPEDFRDYRSDAMARCIGDMVERSLYDVLIAEFSRMGQYVHHNPYLPAVRRIISCHQCATSSSRNARQLMGFGVRAFKEWLKALKLQRYEFDMYRSADRVLALTPRDGYALQYGGPDLSIEVIPSAVDTSVFYPAPWSDERDGILFTGYFDSIVNRDAVLWFARWVWPHVLERHPDLKFYVVGPNPTREMKLLEKKYRGVVVTGRVDDVRTYLDRSLIFVCPERLVVGLRTKILEAMAAGVPVVSTTQGAEGIPVQVGYNCFLGDRPEIMAMYINVLLQDDDLHARVAEKARNLVEYRFSWDRSIECLEDVLENVVCRG